MALILQNISYEQFLSYLIDDTKPHPFVSKEGEIFKVKLDKNLSQIILEKDEGSGFTMSADMIAFKQEYHSYFIAHHFKELDEQEFDKDKNIKHSASQLFESKSDKDNAILVENAISLMINYIEQYTKTFDKRQLVVNDRKELVGFISNQILYIEMNLARKLAETWQVDFHLEDSHSRKKYYQYWAPYLHAGPKDFSEMAYFTEEDKRSSYYKYEGQSNEMLAIPIALY